MQRGGSASTPRLAAVSLAGTVIEFYDFSIYGTAAAQVMGPAFFPVLSPLAGTLAAFGTFTVGCLPDYGTIGAAAPVLLPWQPSSPC